MVLFWKILLTEFVAEMGDKTQLMLIALTSKYKIRDIILGTAAAIIVLTGLAAFAGGFLGSLIPAWLMKLVAAAAFLYFAATSIGGEEEEEKVKTGKLAFAPLAVFCTFFVAELGDKTQLTAITFGANEGLSKAVIVWIACAIGLFAADILGMLAGYLLKSKMPESFLHILAFIVFTIFGLLSVQTGVEMVNEAFAMTLPAGLLTAAAGALFAVICGLLFWLGANKRKRAQS